MTITVYIALETKRFVSHPDLSSPPYMELLRGYIYTLNVIFLSGGAPVELGGTPNGAFVLKDTADGKVLALATPWIKTGTGNTTVYTFQVPMNTAEMAAILLTVDTIPYADVFGSIQYGNEQTFPAIFRIYDSLFNGDETSPTPIDDTMPQFNLTTLTGGGDTALDGQNIGLYAVGQLAWVRRGAGVIAQVDMFSLEAGDFTENTNPLLGPVIVNVDSNPDEFSWIQKL